MFGLVDGWMAIPVGCLMNERLDRSIAELIDSIKHGFKTDLVSG